MVNDNDILTWVNRQIEVNRINAMYAHSRNDMAAFENINVKIRYYERIAEVLEERTEKE